MQQRVVIVETTLQLKKQPNTRRKIHMELQNAVLNRSHIVLNSMHQSFPIIIWKTGVQFYNRNRHRRRQEKLNVVQTDGIHILKTKNKRYNIIQQRIKL